mmetsp:Transcript_39261/g.45020  ORF Transcript_39261/g.45020 Transcript_39261/m.45020 type:complete len:139 (-) Transcript_39261:113-529(-)|eukprot:CAMPEP_0168351792 /NCGR_PEP_ID=MMETSP0213-20121227/22122_1 /TAXON_ID=151035 /ORGANISM="Euplotes harpa, Strain FSP1.4" /LENGTH=138 /DNA_ID=CAMNT_0008362791 /DNA_START=691 /DNA_END=1107 /DNA_ORIENTATION=+
MRAKEINLRLHASLVDQVQYDEKYFYIKSFNCMQLIDLRKYGCDQSKIEQALLNDSNEQDFIGEDEFMIVVPKLNLINFKSDFALKRFLNEQSINHQKIFDIIEFCSSPIIQIEVDEVPEKQIECLLELFPDHTRYNL